MVAGTSVGPGCGAGTGGGRRSPESRGRVGTGGNDATENEGRRLCAYHVVPVGTMKFGGVRKAMAVTKARSEAMLVLVMLFPKQTVEKLGHFEWLLEGRQMGC